MKDIKNTVTTICGLVVAVCGSLLAASFAAKFPEWLQITLGALVAVATAVMGFYSGRNSDGTKKTPGQIEWQAKQKDTPPPID